MVVVGTPFVVYFFARSFEGMSIGGSALLSLVVSAFTVLVIVYIDHSLISTIAFADLLLIVTTIVLRARGL